MIASHFSASQKQNLATFATCLLYGAPNSPESTEALVARCDRRLAALPAHKRARFGTALDLLGGRVAVWLAIKRLTPFAALSADDRARCFSAWGSSRIAPLRTAHQAVRRLVFAVHYGHPAVAVAIGYRGPLSIRQPEFAWEGPAPAIALTRTDSGSAPADQMDFPPLEPPRREPVARAPRALIGIIAHEPLPTRVVIAATLSANVHRKADAVVIGTGAGGAVAAARLAERGFDVVILESGGYHTRADFDEREAELTEKLYAEGALRTTEDMSVALLQGNTVGGSTTVNWMIMLRTPDYVLEQWARESGVEGMSPTEMRAVFEQVEREVHASEVPEDAHSANNRLVLDGARRLGWRVRSANINARDCVRCGFCGVGCRHDAKQSTLVTFVPRALAAGAMLYADAHVDRIAVLERDTGSGTPPLKRVVATVRGGGSSTNAHSITVDAPLVIVAGGAVGTPTLLQRSGFGGGGVGNWLRLHPTTAVMGHYGGRDIVPSTGIPLTTMCDEFIRWNDSDYGFWIETPPMHPSFTAAAMPGIAREHARRMAEFNRIGVLIALTRDGAQRDHSSGRVSVNRRGETAIHYALAPEDQRRMRASLVAAAQLHFAAGASEVTTMHTHPIHVCDAADAQHLASGSLAANDIALFSAHVNGTCRMGTDPATSGATPDGERHGVRGLYISDGSLLPTALGVNPQETIMAVTTVLAERLATRHAGVMRP